VIVDCGGKIVHSPAELVLVDLTIAIKVKQAKCGCELGSSRFAALVFAAINVF